MSNHIFYIYNKGQYRHKVKTGYDSSKTSVQTYEKVGYDCNGAAVAAAAAAKMLIIRLTISSEVREMSPILGY